MTFFFFFNDTATTEIYTLSLHDALPIWSWSGTTVMSGARSSAHGGTSMTCFAFAATFRSPAWATATTRPSRARTSSRSEEHTSELQSRLHLVCRLLLEKKKQKREPTRHA